MNQTRFLNPSQPQMLLWGNLLLYIDAFFNIINRWPGDIRLKMVAISVAMAVGGWGIANEKKWGYVVGVVSAALQVLVLVSYLGRDVFAGLNIISVGFDVALVALLVHPQSRDYQKIWFH